jgi:hypothetical protein
MVRINWPTFLKPQTNETANVCWNKQLGSPVTKKKKIYNKINYVFRNKIRFLKFISKQVEDNIQ